MKARLCLEHLLKIKMEYGLTAKKQNKNEKCSLQNHSIKISKWNCRPCRKCKDY